MPVSSQLFQQSVGKEEMVRLAVRDLNEEEPFYRHIENELRAMLDDPACPVRPCTPAEMVRLELLLEEITEGGDQVLETAMAVSLQRIRQEGSWDPVTYPDIAKLLRSDVETFKAMRNALGVIALAWQVQQHPRHIILT